MRKLAAILAIVLASAILHFGAMSAVQVLSQVDTSHSAHSAEHGSPFMPTCPSGYVCPSLPMNATSVALGGILLICLAVWALIASTSPAPVFSRFSRIDFVPPDDSRTLLSIFKRE